MFEDFNFGSRQSCPKYKWGMVQLITDYQIPLTHQGGDVGGVGSKPHSKCHCSWLAKKTCNKSLQFIMKVKSTWRKDILSATSNQCIKDRLGITQSYSKHWTTIYCSTITVNLTQMYLLLISKWTTYHTHAVSRILQDQIYGLPVLQPVRTVQHFPQSQGNYKNPD